MKWNMLNSFQNGVRIGNGVICGVRYTYKKKKYKKITLQVPTSSHRISSSLRRFKIEETENIIRRLCQRDYVCIFIVLE